MNEFDTDVRTAQLVKHIKDLEQELFQKEIIIRKYENDKQALVAALNNILGESFK